MMGDRYASGDYNSSRPRMADDGGYHADDGYNADDYTRSRQYHHNEYGYHYSAPPATRHGTHNDGYDAASVNYRGGQHDIQPHPVADRRQYGDIHGYGDRLSASPKDYNGAPQQQPIPDFHGTEQQPYSDDDLHAFAAEEIRRRQDDPSVVYPDTLHFGQDDQTIVSNVTDLHTVHYQTDFYPSLQHVPDDETVEDPFHRPINSGRQAPREGIDGPPTHQQNGHFPRHNDRTMALQEETEGESTSQVGTLSTGINSRATSMSDAQIKDDAKKMATGPQDDNPPTLSIPAAQAAKADIPLKQSDDASKSTSGEKGPLCQQPKENQDTQDSGQQEDCGPRIATKHIPPSKLSQALAASTNSNEGFPGAFHQGGGPNIHHDESRESGNHATESTLVAEVSAADQKGAEKLSESPDNNNKNTKTRSLTLLVTLCLVVLVVIATIGGVCGSGMCGGGSEQGSMAHSFGPTSEKYLEYQRAILDVFGDDYFEGKEDETPQYKAFDWILNRDVVSPQDDQFIQRFIMAVLYFHTTQSQHWLNCGDKALETCETLEGRFLGSNWLSTTNECIWGGVACDHNAFGDVTELTLTSNKLNGQLPTELALLSKLTILNLRDNDYLTGTLPSELYTLTALEELNLSGNSFSGDISTEIGLMTSLSKLDLSSNDFLGRLPDEQLSLLSGLYQLDVSYNEGLHGKIPQAVCDNVHSHADLAEEIVIKADCLAYMVVRTRFTCPEGCCTECCDNGGCFPAD
ncbi:receptor-like protein kinase [Seminavis robusta]|uniref:Receptor-like protein kinase n=1 Tax=Seminavis robusta TaxID=568900 RepID=A0A9N8DBU9_9STRA|nr:receptor-like protein kinase [Seminavis robusta]|eukprot:Sro49_g028500.1 receptor-like protein kinase (745) ;mRNA; f:16021-18255